MNRRDFIRNLEVNITHYFKEKNYNLSKKYGYILESYANWGNNIILGNVTNYLKNWKQVCENNKLPFPLHKCLHHGLSSQAYLFNLLGPFVVPEDWLIFKEVIMLSKSKSGANLPLSGNISKAEFEFSDRKTFNENKGQPTSIDLSLGTDKNEKVFVEFKFTEPNFGSCSVYENGDCDGANPSIHPHWCYLNGLKRTYMDLMEKYGLLNNFEYCPFIEFYQAYRLLLFSLENSGDFLFIYDDRNPTFVNELNGAPRGKLIRFIKLLPQKYQENIFMLSIREIIKHLEKHSNYAWLEEFKNKYAW